MSHRERDDDVHTETTHHDPNPNESGKWVSALIALLGVWMIVQVLVLDLSTSQFWNDIAVGALLLAVGAYNYSRRANERLGNTAAAIIAVLAGLWLIAAPFVVGPDAGTTETVNDAAFWNDIVVGLLAIVLGAYSAYKVRDNQRDVRRRTAT